MTCRLEEKWEVMVVMIKISESGAIFMARLAIECYLHARSMMPIMVLNQNSPKTLVAASKRNSQKKMPL
jgi:hypothetical protein